MKMRKRMTQDELREKIKRTPLWMQKIAFAALDERDDALRKLEAKTESQKPTPFFKEDYEISERGHKKRRTYFDADREIVIVHNGIRVEVRVDSNNMRDGKGVYVNFSVDDDGLGRAGVCLVPIDRHAIEFRKPNDVR
jgi:hypothetical protein